MLDRATTRVGLTRASNSPATPFRAPYALAHTRPMERPALRVAQART